MKLHDILVKLTTGEFSVERAEAFLSHIDALLGDNSTILSVGHTARLDPGRAARSGIAEAILAEGKQPAEVVEFLSVMASETGCALATRVRPHVSALIQSRLASRFELEVNQRARTVVVKKSDYTPARLGRSIGILAAGTADLPVAEEARVAAELMGCQVMTAYDVGVAGLHRLFGPLREMVEGGADAIVVVAGMEGALPTVVKGLVPLPVIGVPTSTGYGFGAKGRGALVTMLQSCSPGLTVVNIDNGFGAAAAAAMIARRAAAAALPSSKQH